MSKFPLIFHSNGTLVVKCEGEMSSSVWFNVRYCRPRARVRLVCFPWSGGGSQWYGNWGSSAPAHVEGKPGEGRPTVSVTILTVIESQTGSI